jgi:F-type H+-transporting ATPase subunit alpha
VEIFKQPQYQPMPVEQQVLILYVLTHKYFSNVHVENTRSLASTLMTFVDENYNSILIEIREKQDISPELEDKIKAAIEEFMQDRA